MKIPAIIEWIVTIHVTMAGMTTIIVIATIVQHAHGGREADIWHHHLFRVESEKKTVAATIKL